MWDWIVATLRESPELVALLPACLGPGRIDEVQDVAQPVCVSVSQRSVAETGEYRQRCPEVPLLDRFRGPPAQLLALKLPVLGHDHQDPRRR